MLEELKFIIGIKSGMNLIKKKTKKKTGIDFGKCPLGQTQVYWNKLCSLSGNPHLGTFQIPLCILILL